LKNPKYFNKSKYFGSIHRESMWPYMLSMGDEADSGGNKKRNKLVTIQSFGEEHKNLRKKMEKLVKLVNRMVSELTPRRHRR